MWHLDLVGQQAILAKGEWLIPMDRQPTVSAKQIGLFLHLLHFCSYISFLTYDA